MGGGRRPTFLIMESTKALELMRLGNKLNLWRNPGFFQFIEDLALLKGDECDIRGCVHSLKKIYEAREQELLPKGKYEQGKLDI